MIEEKVLTLAEMLKKNAEDKPHKTALIYRDLEYSYEGLNDLVSRLANRLVTLGVEKGDRIGLMLKREPHLIIAFLASIKIGAIPAPINYNLTPKQLAGLLSSMNPSLIFTRKDFFELIQDVANKENISVALTDERKYPHFYWEDLMKYSSGNISVNISKNDIAYLNYTSGSTGNQKGAMATHDNIYWNTVASVETFDITENDVHLCMFAPFAHPHELLARPLYTGGTMVLLDEIFPKSLAKAIKEHGVTCIMGLAPMYEMLLDVAGNDDLSSLRLPESGGMFTTPGLIARFKKKFGVPIYPVWGSTETTGIAVANKLNEKMKDGSIGIPCPHYEVRVVDETGVEVAVDEVGELIFKGQGVVSGYFDMGEEDIDCFKDGWYYSGDLGRVDEDGYIYFVDRKSFMMKVAGLKVYPMEIEKVLSLHPNIKDVAVVKTSCGLRGEVPKAIIVPVDDQSISKNEVFHFCKGHMPNYMIPKILEIRDELPKMASGKTNKKALIEEEVVS